MVFGWVVAVCSWLFAVVLWIVRVGWVCCGYVVVGSAKWGDLGVGITVLVSRLLVEL